MNKADFLVEIGTEELPPKALRALMDAFADNLAAALDSARLAHGSVHRYASPRRLAVIVDELAAAQEDRTSVQKGPPVSVAFDDAGKPQPPALAFAKKCGVSVDELSRKKTAKGEWLSCEVTEPGEKAAALLPGLVGDALAALPIPRRMRWGDGDAEFVRPVHWLVMLHGRKIVSGTVLGVDAGRKTYGHRFHSKTAISIPEPAAYLDQLESKGHVIADFEKRRALVEKGVTKVAKRAGGVPVGDDTLYDEVSALVEWPVPMPGSFDEKYLELPREVVISTLAGHQRYFPVADSTGTLLPCFVTVANLDSKDPDQVRQGNERVIRPRLADATFFWDTDRNMPLSGRMPELRNVVYQRGLGSLFDKSERTAALAASIARSLEAASQHVERAALLSKCDLLTGMVGEFPELQGVMGRYYASSDGEPEPVAVAIGEHYHPRFARDELPTSADGRILAVADKLDTLAGIFAIGKTPSGKRDPFGLRRAALGVIRILVECDIDIDLPATIAEAVNAQPRGNTDAGRAAEALSEFITERLRGYFLDRDTSLDAETFEAVRAREPVSLVDFARRLAAVQAFLKLDEAASLASANKRIANILKQAGDEGGDAVTESLLTDPAETRLFAALGDASDKVAPLIADRRYTEALRALAALREPVDGFFDDVMVMHDDDAIRNNRLALLGQLRKLFLDVADISRLAIA